MASLPMVLVNAQAAAQQAATLQARGALGSLMTAADLSGFFWPSAPAFECFLRLASFRRSLGCGGVGG